MAFTEIISVSQSWSDICSVITNHLKNLCCTTFGGMWTCRMEGCSTMTHGSDVITTSCNTGSSFSACSLWSPHRSSHSWLRFHIAASGGGRRAVQSTTYPPRSPTANDRPGNAGLPTPGEQKQPVRLWWNVSSLLLSAKFTVYTLKITVFVINGQLVQGVTHVCLDKLQPSCRCR